MPKPIRRVVTGHDAAGHSVFVMDTAAPHVYCRSPGSAVVTELWETRSAPADNRGRAEVTDHAFRLVPPKNGTVFRIIEYPPDRQRLAALEAQRAGADDGSGHAAAFDRGARRRARFRASVRRADFRVAALAARFARQRGAPRHPGFHKTASVDYAIVLNGEIYALMDEGEVLLKAGDVLIQRGTNHAWSNRSDEPATLAFVLVDAEPA
jgi:quercetin dioxygenase-like cupin family protein